SLFRGPPHSALFPSTTLFRSPRRASAPPLRLSFGHGQVVALCCAGVELARPADLLMRILDHLVPLGDPADGARHREEHGKHGRRSEEHTSELQSRENLVCRLL